MSNLIERKNTADAMERWLYDGEDNRTVREVVYELPSAQPDLNEWCTDCKEYDKEKHCCPRFNRVIREALKDAQPEIIRCGQCKYAEVADSEDSQDGYTCQFHRGSVWFSGSYCSWAERREEDGH